MSVPIDRSFWFVAAATTLLINALLVVPEWWMPYSAFAAPLIAAETLLLMGLVGLMGLMPAAIGRLIAAFFAVAVLLALGLALSDLGTAWALGRPMNLAIDLPLAQSVVHLLSGAIGKPLAWLVLSVAGMAVILLWLGIFCAFQSLSLRSNSLAKKGVAVLSIILGLVLWQQRDAALMDESVDTPMHIRLSDQVERVQRTLIEREAFAQALVAPSTESLANFSRLDGRDVVMAFVESYGVSFLHDPRYQAVAAKTQQAMASALDQAGLAVVTASLRSPVQGGQSWLAHASALSGHWIDNQIRYDLFLSAGSSSLMTDFKNAGYQTAAIMPAITEPWPAGKQWGYDQIHDYAAIDYAGPALNWVTMPDQYTWHYFAQQVRATTRAPLFAELALISSHAPWTPILPRLNWDALSDGRLFLPWAEVGPSPAVLWSNQADIQRFYARAIDYALQTAAEWAARDLDDGILVLLGDHQAAPLITGNTASRAVPVHIISADKNLLSDFTAHGFEFGLSAPTDSTGSLADLRGYMLRVLDVSHLNSASATALGDPAMAPSIKPRQE